MSWEQIIGISIALIIMLIGLIGSVVPVLPGTPVVLIAAIGHRLYFGAASISNLFLVVLVVLTVISLVLDLIASTLGAKKFGATWRGMTGAVIGGIVGLFFNIPGIILGPFLGAMILEMTGGKEFKIAAKAGAGAVIGLLIGVVGKFSICVMMIGLFATNTIYRTMNQPTPATSTVAQVQRHRLADNLLTNASSCSSRVVNLAFSARAASSF
ncbi:MAG TPA: DUF456 domain-containing protein [Verrucomicrobiae bacterium]|nr:DUF456 domain-containing protein [Verrucomicrobiae bacterium]